MVKEMKKKKLIYILNVILFFALLATVFLYFKLSYLPITKDYLKRSYQLEKWHTLTIKYIEQKNIPPKDLLSLALEMDDFSNLEGWEPSTESTNRLKSIDDPNELKTRIDHIIVLGEKEWFIVEKEEKSKKSRMFINNEGIIYITRILFNEKNK